MRKAQEESELLWSSLCCVSKRQSSDENKTPQNLKALEKMMSKAKISMDPVTKLLNFPSEDRWLNGEEYAFLIRHYKAYSMAYPKNVTVTEKMHPECVYD